MSVSKHSNLLLLLLLIASFCAGCSSDLSRAEPFKQLVGSDVTLVRDMEFRVPTKGKDKRVDLDTPYGPGSTSTMSEHLALVPAGTRLHVSAVKSIYVIKGHNVVVFGTGLVPGTTRQVEWSFVWGHLGGDTGHLQRAPWEDPQSVPENRRLLDKGHMIADW